MARRTTAWQNTSMATGLRICVGTALWLALAFSARASIPGRQVALGHVPSVVARLQPLGDLPETNRLNLAIGLPLRRPEELRRLLRDLYDPASPRYRQFLKPQD